MAKIIQQPALKTVTGFDQIKLTTLIKNFFDIYANEVYHFNHLRWPKLEPSLSFSLNLSQFSFCLLNINMLCHIVCGNLPI